MRRSESDDTHADAPLEVQLESVQPGDVLDIWAEGDRVVTTLFVCQEVVDGRTYRWRWCFLDDGTLIEVSPDGTFRYREHRLVKQGTSLYEEIVAQDGALVRFEEHVRAGTAAHRPVHVVVDERQYRITSTGTLTAERSGEETTLLPWNSLSREADENVYFGFYDVEDESRVGVGLWTAHVCLSIGQVFDASDIIAIYPSERHRR